MLLENKEIFHVHTFRCGHAIDSDEFYVLSAIAEGATKITFTDHAPFPGDPFRNRMKMDELENYISNLSHLGRKYSDKIQVAIGLEIEYLPSYISYYKELRDMDGIDLLLLGQHHSEIAPGKYTFNRQDKSYEWKYLMDAQTEGVSTGLFDAVAHPDRAFKREKLWTPEMEKASRKFIDTALEYNIPLEKNMASLRHRRQYWQEFWSMVPEKLVIYGCDAHKACDLYLCNKDIFNWMLGNGDRL